MPDTTPPQPRGRTFAERFLPADSFVARALHVFVLSALAIAQPLWELLGRNAEFFVARRADRTEILAVALLVLLVPPLVTIAVIEVSGLVSKRLRSVLHALAVAGFALLLFLRVLSRAIGDPALLTVAIALVAAAGVTAYYLTTRGARRVLTALGPLPLVFLALFVTTAGMRPLVFPEDGGDGVAVRFERRPPVVFLVLDEFPLRGLLKRDLTIDEERVPNIAAFAKASTWYRKTTSVHEVSEMAVPAILAGVRSPKKQVPIAANFPVNLFSTFTGGGYEVRASEVLTRLCTPRTCTVPEVRPPLKQRVKSQLKDLGIVYGHQVLPPDLATQALPDISLTWGGFGNAGDGADPKQPTQGGIPANGARGDLGQPQEPRLEQFLGTLTKEAHPTLYYAHLLIPHAPFDRLPTGERYTKGSSFIGLDMKTGYFEDEEYATDQAEARNILQVGYADRVIGRIMDTLKKAGIYDEALVVIASDHGSTNRPKFNRRAFEVETLGDLASVPLFVKVPGQTTGELVDTQAETIDVLPTVADVLGFRLPDGVTGRSLRGNPPPRERVLIDQFGNVFKAPPEFPQLQESVDHMYARFAHDGDRLNLYATGPYKGIVGRQVGELGTAPGTMRAKLDQPDYWTKGAPAGFSPTHQTGTFEGRPAGTKAGDPVHLAVAVGDEIVATARTFDVDGDAAKLDLFVPDDKLAPGHPQVRLFAVTGDAARPRLTPVAVG
ncbi:MAG TPA: sulfatase-like hydrolase/transferase [Frankiaceae bacterium]|nr:sulfatase-like hydrolase/transferase [Frankiaceae bacterium]